MKLALFIGGVISAQNSYNIWLARQKYEDVLKIDIEEFKRICKQDKKDI